MSLQGIFHDVFTLEVAIAGAVFVIILGLLAVATANANHREGQVQDTARSAPDVARIDVTAHQWCWQFQHLDGPATANGTCTEDPSTRPVLVVPVDRPVELRLHSHDVVHALWIPDLQVNSDVYPEQEYQQYLASGGATV